ncbi:hypothetical protein JTE90_024321 [Oedothorax gibbosus]|uniref:Uncharacterized protein n=1 Tax=Oedothorax gibbosus TaxID=931172 RepID=A0AAV6W0Y1_9ARAC|nr:hypothetical protein JTE90_024321 [Oedothorax gibbosus]
MLRPCDPESWLDCLALKIAGSAITNYSTDRSSAKTVILKTREYTITVSAEEEWRREQLFFKKFCVFHWLEPEATTVLIFEHGGESREKRP